LCGKNFGECELKGFILRDGDLGYRFIPKVASSSIKSTLLTLEGVAQKNVHKLGKRQARIDDCKQRVIVIRDPIKRFLSAYGNRVGYHKELSKEYLNRRLPIMHHFLPHLNPSLNQFIRYYKIYARVQTIKHHTKPISSWLMGNDLSFFTDVYKIEELTKFEQDLSDLFNQEVKFPRKQTGGKKHTLKSLNKRQIRYLLKLYDEDYKLLKGHYTKEMVWDEWRSLTNS